MSWRGRGTSESAWRASASSSSTRSTESHSPAMYDSPKPILPSTPSRARNLSGSNSSMTGPLAGPKQVPSGNSTRMPVCVATRRRKRRASAARIGADFGGANAVHRSRSTTACRSGSWETTLIVGCTLSTACPEPHRLPTDQNGDTHGRVKEGCAQHASSACDAPLPSKRCHKGGAVVVSMQCHADGKRWTGLTHPNVVVAIDGIERRHVEFLVSLRIVRIRRVAEDRCDAHRRCCALQPRRRPAPRPRRNTRTR